MVYRVEFTTRAARDLRGFSRELQARLLLRIESLAADPRPNGVVWLNGQLEGLLRIRLGGYRIVYKVDDDQHLVTVAWIGRRDEVYR